MATVPKGKEIYIGAKVYKAGDELPANYRLKEKKSSQSSAQKLTEAKK
jgi:hypothetical protein